MFFQSFAPSPILSPIEASAEPDIEDPVSISGISLLEMSSNAQVAVRSPNFQIAAASSSKKDKWNSAKKCLRPRIR